jgi:hypothetical protein
MVSCLETELASSIVIQTTVLKTTLNVSGTNGMMISARR